MGYKICRTWLFINHPFEQSDPNQRCFDIFIECDGTVFNIKIWRSYSFQQTNTQSE